MIGQYLLLNLLFPWKSNVAECNINKLRSLNNPIARINAIHILFDYSAFLIEVPAKSFDLKSTCLFQQNFEQMESHRSPHQYLNLREEDYSGF
jgi:hypothetical protein